jgi:hypothetical protein
VDAAKQPNAPLDIAQQKLAVQSAKDALQLVLNPMTPQDIAIARTTLAQAKQTLANDQAIFNTDSQIVAPTDGTIQAVNIVVGQSSAASGSSSSSSSSSSAAIQMDSSQGLEVTANIPEVSIGQVQVGDPVAMTFNAFPSKTYVGLITQLPLQATITSNVATYPVHVSLTGDTQGIAVGMTANLTIVTASVQNAIEVPTQAVTTTGAGSFVRTLDSKNQVQLVRVQTGISDTTDTQIISGLAVGDRVLVPRTSGLTNAATNGFGGGRGFGGGGGGFGGGGAIFRAGGG